MNLSLPNQTQHGHINKHIIERNKEMRACSSVDGTDLSNTSL